jgi:hypothetical protein
MLGSDRSDLIGPGVLTYNWQELPDRSRIQAISRDAPVRWRGAVTAVMAGATSCRSCSVCCAPAVVCRNPLLVGERARKRQDLLAATEADLARVAKAVTRQRKPLLGADQIGLAAGAVLNRHKMAKHFTLTITEDHFAFVRNQASIEAESQLDGIYVIRTNLAADDLAAPEVVRSYKDLSRAERAFRSLKTVDLEIRPIHHRLPDRVRAHVLLCMLAYYVEWHMRQVLAPVLFDDHQRDEAAAARTSIVAPAQRSTAARKAANKLTEDGLLCSAFNPCSPNSPHPQHDGPCEPPKRQLPALSASDTLAAPRL